jgi:hypothetical protein
MNPKRQDNQLLRLKLPTNAVQRLRRAGIYCSPGVTIEFQQGAKRHVLRGRESGGATKEFGHYVSFCGSGGERLPWFVRPDSLVANGDHAVVIAPSMVSVEVLRVEHTYELLIVRHELRAEREGARPRIWSKLVFRGWQGQLPLDLVNRDRSVAGQIAPEFFTRAGDLRQLPAPFVEAVQAVVSAANCPSCTHPHLLVAPKPPAEEMAVGSRSSGHEMGPPTGENDSESTGKTPRATAAV